MLQGPRVRTVRVSAVVRPADQWLGKPPGDEVDPLQKGPGGDRAGKQARDRPGDGGAHAGSLSTPRYLGGNQNCSATAGRTRIAGPIHREPRRETSMSDRSEAGHDDFAAMAAPTAEHAMLKPFEGTFAATVKMWMGPGEPAISTGSSNRPMPATRPRARSRTSRAAGSGATTRSTASGRGSGSTPLQPSCRSSAARWTTPARSGRCAAR